MMDEREVKTTHVGESQKDFIVYFLLFIFMERGKFIIMDAS